MRWAQKKGYTNYFLENAEQGDSRVEGFPEIVKNVYDFFGDEDERYKLNYNKAIWYFSQNSTE